MLIAEKWAKTSTPQIASTSTTKDKSNSQNHNKITMNFRYITLYLQEFTHHSTKNQKMLMLKIFAKSWLDFRWFNLIIFSTFLHFSKIYLGKESYFWLFVSFIYIVIKLLSKNYFCCLLLLIYNNNFVIFYVALTNMNIKELIIYKYYTNYSRTSYINTGIRWSCFSIVLCFEFA